MLPKAAAPVDGGMLGASSDPQFTPVPLEYWALLFFSKAKAGTLPLAT